MKKKVVIIVLVLVVLIAVFALVKTFMGGNKAPTGIPMEVEKITKDTIITTVSAKGEVSLLNKELVFANSNAEVEEVLVEKNDTVKKGDVLLRYKEKSKEKIESQLRDAELALQSSRLSVAQSSVTITETEVESADLSISVAENKITDLDYNLSTIQVKIDDQKRKIEDAQRKFDTTKTLFDAGAASKQEYDDAEKVVVDLKYNLEVIEKEYSQTASTRSSLEDDIAYKKSLKNELLGKNSTKEVANTKAQRQISVQQAQLKVNELRKDLADFQYEIVSPIDGTITSLDISKGAITQTDKSLMEISDVKDFVVKVDVNERNAAKIQINQEALISGSVLGKETVTGKVSKIASIAEQKQTTNGTERVVSVEITVDRSSKSAELLKPGFSLEAIVTTEVKEAIVVVPILSTLKDSDGSNYVFIVNSDNTIERRTVELGVYSDMTVEVIDGLSVDETVLSQPSFNLTDGMAIEPISADAMLGEGTETEGEGK